MKLSLSTVLLCGLATLVAPQAMAANAHQSSTAAAADVANNNRPKTTRASMNASVNAGRNDASVSGASDTHNSSRQTRGSAGGGTHPL